MSRKLTDERRKQLRAQRRELGCRPLTSCVSWRDGASASASVASLTTGALVTSTSQGQLWRRNRIIEMKML